MHFLTDVTMQIQADVEHGHARVDRKSESRTKRVEATTDRPICAVFVYKNRSRGWNNISVDEKLRFYEILTVRSHEGETTRELQWRAKKAMGNCYEQKGFGDRQRLEWGQRLFETLWMVSWILSLFFVGFLQYIVWQATATGTERRWGGWVPATAKARDV